MRYENWDVLLFPENSKVPIQEFKTQCFVTRDQDSPYLQSPSIMGPAAYQMPQGNLGQIPVLTTFVPSLPHNSCFRVSIHSWDKPRPSRLMDSLLQPDDQLSYEVRVFVDGMFISATAFGHRTNWPHVIELSNNIDKSGNPDTLRFPPFHPDVLEQRHWDAGDPHGRIRIVIAEGFHRPNRSVIPFERVKDVVVFSFQHAPLQILEYSNIAWPNSGMWSQGPRFFKYHGGFNDAKELDDAHAHSPTKNDMRAMPSTRSQVSNSALYTAWAYRNYQTPSVWQHNATEARWPSQEPLVPDSCIDPYMLDPALRHRGARSSIDDIPMPDYMSSSASSRAFSSMTGISYEHSKQPSLVGPLAEEQYNQFIEALSPPKMPPIGTLAPTNTPSATLPMGRKLSAAAEARSASYSKSGSRPSVLKEISQPGSREVSGSSAKSTIPPDAILDTLPASKLHVSPNGPIRGRKEGSSDNKENEAVETSRKESDRVNNTPTKSTRRTSGSVEVTGEHRRSRSGGSEGGEIARNSKEGVLAISPPKDLPCIGKDDHVHQSGFNDFLDPRLPDSGVQIEVSDIE